MDLVHRERGLVDRAVAPVRHPVLVPPLVVRGGDDGGGRGRDLGAAGHRIGPDRVRAVRAADIELVERALPDAGQEQLPHPGRAERAHRRARAVPVGEVTGHPHPARVRRPYGEPGPGHPLVDHRLRAERPPQLLVAALPDQMQIQLTERGQEAVRVVHLDGVVVVRDPEPVGGDLLHRQHPGEEPVAVVVQFGLRPVGQHRDRPGERAQRPHQHPARDRPAPSTACGSWWSPASSRPRSAGSRAAAGRALPSPACRGSGGTASVRRGRERLAGAAALVAAGAAVSASTEAGAGAGAAAGTGVAAGACAVSMPTASAVVASAAAADLERGALRDGLRAVTGTASSGSSGEEGGRGVRAGGARVQAAADWARRWMAAIGTGSQSGRCRASYTTSYTALSVSWARSSSGSPRGSVPDASAYPSQ